MMNVQRTSSAGDDSTGPMPTMRAVVHDRYGAPSVLSVRTVDTPTPAEGQVLVRVAAASLNPLDWHVTTGTPYALRLMAGFRAPKQAVRGADVAGVVAAIGPGVEGVDVGDRVVGVAAGSFAEYALARPKHLAHLPVSVPFTDAAALPVAGVTALQAVRDHAKVGTGDRVLVNGAAGGVGTFAVQLAVAMGAEVTAVCSRRNVEMVRGLGPARVVDYGAEDWVDGTRYDAIVDNVGNRSIADCKRSLEDGGRYVMVSGPKDNPWLDPFRRLIAGRIRFIGSGRSFRQFTATETAEDVQALLEQLVAGRVHAVVERTLPLDEVADALAYLGTGHARAKLVVEIAPAADQRPV